MNRNITTWRRDYAACEQGTAGDMLDLLVDYMADAPFWVALTPQEKHEVMHDYDAVASALTGRYGDVSAYELDCEVEA
jgi:hypothetical protein